MSKRGALVVYDVDGTILYVINDCYSEGIDIEPHNKPKGIPSMEFEYGELDGKELIRIDVSVPDNHKPIFKI
ncbi:hypothetical protein [Vallitalea guaymasensis]|uniref:Uncharacterized protein n=1 Tax=Vallitalea guaymasensis TaxID=1185412 RepID=A0A8J8MB39_9FIRM|nr:hypothetical protein [Vallitalea guaymasensis]QUH29652.1 hypothetical protein HYG85_12340 [Vallitalea guaymasensis]